MPTRISYSSSPRSYAQLLAAGVRPSQIREAIDSGLNPAQLPPEYFGLTGGYTPQSVGSGAPPSIGGIDIPPSDMTDPYGGGSSSIPSPQPNVGGEGIRDWIAGSSNFGYYGLPSPYGTGGGPTVEIPTSAPTVPFQPYTPFTDFGSGYTGTSAPPSYLTVNPNSSAPFYLSNDPQSSFDLFGTPPSSFWPSYEPKVSPADMYASMMDQPTSIEPSSLQFGYDYGAGIPAGGSADFPTNYDYGGVSGAGSADFPTADATGLPGGSGPMSPYDPAYPYGAGGSPLYSFGSGTSRVSVSPGGSQIGAYYFPGMSGQTAAAIASHINAGAMDLLSNVGSGDPVKSGNIAVSESAGTGSELKLLSGANKLGRIPDVYEAYLASQPVTQQYATGWKFVKPMSFGGGFQQKPNPYIKSWNPSGYVNPVYGSSGSWVPTGYTTNPSLGITLQQFLGSSKPSSSLGSPGSGTSGGLMSGGASYLPGSRG